MYFSVILSLFLLLSGTSYVALLLVYCSSFWTE